ncbi:hypothetical protein [Motiliproteus sp. MSK22-1]|uniref:hypothetical protein n=1 Tax=Motiliproteus sp. MSK22-1 TaxID=1897630 RepID=UPI0009782F57|nr:hypothetical protein [Motiliproteus sp. MSK22-1]OMH36540.1 hypothetical protein BGP75_09650 [Motiliproteus sp. MSK22-1]
MKLKLYYADGGNHPVLGQVYHQCQEFIDGRDVARYQRYLANILSCIAQSVDDCDRVLAEVAMIEEGRESKSEIEGNDVDVLISLDGIQVDINVNDKWVGQPEGRFSLTEFKAVVAAWRKFLHMPESFNSEVIIEL